MSVVLGTMEATDVDEAIAFLDGLGDGGAMVIKAIAGGGGRGMRVVRSREEAEGAHERCRSEAAAAFGDGRVYVEQLVENVRHIEVQVLGDHTGAVVHLGERDCSIQRRHQKLIEIAPAPALVNEVREALTRDALRIASEVGFENAGTVEFLVRRDGAAEGPTHWFIEANARLQVEHTVTEEVMGVDLVQAQLRLAAGDTLTALGLDVAPSPRGFAVQARVNLETVGVDGAVRPTGGVLRVFEPPTGPGLRTDTFASTGYQTNPSFDSLLAKIVGHAPSSNPGDAIERTARALRELRIEGVDTNASFLLAILDHPEVRAGRTTTDFVDRNVAELANSALPVAPSELAPGARRAGATVDTNDPLAVLHHGKASAGRRSETRVQSVDSAVVAPIQGTVVSIEVAPGEAVHRGQPLLVMEAMKMEHVIESTMSGIVRALNVSIGDTVFEGHPLVVVDADDVERGDATVEAEVDLDRIRPDLAEVLERQGMTRDDVRPEAVARRRATDQRTARENVEDLCDAGTFVEYGLTGDRRATATAHDGRPDRADAGRRIGRGHRPGEWSTSSATRPHGAW